MIEEAVLVAEKSKILVANLSAQSIRKYLRIKNVTLIVPEEEVEIFIKYIGGEINIISENTLIPDGNTRIKKILKNKARSGWYLQQFLKFEFSELSTTDKFLIWDADTILLSKIDLIKEGKYVFTKSYESYDPYKNLFKSVFMKNFPLLHSAISQHMVVEKKFLSAIKMQLEKNGQPWWESLLEMINENKNFDFSEYEFYAGYLNNLKPELVSFVDRPWFRHGEHILKLSNSSSLESIEKKFKGYDFVAFENHKTNVFKKIFHNMNFILN